MQGIGCGSRGPYFLRNEGTDMDAIVKRTATVSITLEIFEKRIDARPMIRIGESTSDAPLPLKLPFQQTIHRDKDAGPAQTINGDANKPKGTPSNAEGDLLRYEVKYRKGHQKSSHCENGIRP